MDIRKELNKLSVPQLKAIARKHNAHFIIKVKQRKADLVEKLAVLYENMRDNLIEARAYKINVKNPKQNIITKRTMADKNKTKAGVDLLEKMDMASVAQREDIDKLKASMQKKKAKAGVDLLEKMDMASSAQRADIDKLKAGMQAIMKQI